MTALLPTTPGAMVAHYLGVYDVPAEDGSTHAEIERWTLPVVGWLQTLDEDHEPARDAAVAASDDAVIPASGRAWEEETQRTRLCPSPGCHEDVSYSLLVAVTLAGQEPTEEQIATEVSLQAGWLRKPPRCAGCQRKAAKAAQS